MNGGHARTGRRARLTWLIGLWLAGVAALALVALIVKLLLAV